jgi:hypothetical protein
MPAKDKILKFVENRRLEAIKDQIGNKMILIVRSLGQKITSVQKPQENYFLYQEEVPEAAGKETISGWTESDYGWYFDGLRFGTNLTITCMGHEDKIFEIKCTYNGYCVFEEIEGNIKSYAPFPEWRNKLEDFYLLSSQREMTKKKLNKTSKIENNQKKMNGIIQKLKLLWNY